MPVELVNGHVVIPDPANWREAVDWSRRFQVSIEEALTGAEDRARFRARPLQQLAWTVTPWDANQESRLEDRVRAALKSGKAAAPYHGRAAVLTNTVVATATIVKIDACPWVPVAGDCVLFGDPQQPLKWEVREVSSFNAGNRNITLTSGLTYGWTAGGMLWPLLFGKLVFDAEDAETSQRGNWPLRLEELRSTDLASMGGASNVVTPAAPTYTGTPVFPFAINWAQNPGRRFRYDLKELQLGFGSPANEASALHVVHGFEFRFELTTDQEISNCDGFTASGRAAAFWLPSPVEAMQVYAGVSTTQFDVVDQQLAETLADHPSVHLWFTKEGQTAQAAKISTVVDQGNGRERVTLTSALGVAVDETWTAQRLHLVRLAEDTERAKFTAEGWQTRTLRVVEVPLEYNQIGTGGLYAHYRLEEASGTRADAHGSRHLTPGAAPVNRTGKLGQALALVAANAESLNDNGGLSNLPTGSFTWTGWVIFDSITANAGLIGRWNSGVKSYIVRQVGGVISFSISPDNTSETTVNSTVSLSTSVWYFFAAWWDGTNIGIRVNAETPVTTAAATIRIGSGTFYIGYNSVNAVWLNGGLDSLSPWARALSSGELDALYNGGLGLDYPFSSQPQPQWLYQFTLQSPTPVNWYYTSAERDYTAHSATWLAKAVDHNGIKRTLFAEGADVTLEAFYEAGHPLSLWLPYPPSAKMLLQIWEDVAGVRTLMFTGTVRDVDFKGRRITARASSWLTELDRRVPGVMFQPRCNKHLFDANCGLVRTAWEVAATIETISGVNVRVNVGAFTTGDPEYFSFGEIQHGDGTTFESRTIMLAVKVTGQPKWDLRLNLPFKTLAVSDAVKLWPGDDGSIITCHSKFANKSRFLGFPFMPADNPTLNPLTPKTATPKK